MGTRPRCGYCWRDHRGDRRASAVSVLRPVPERVKTGLYQLIPASKRPGFIEVAEDIAASIGRYIFGLFMLSLINGVLAAIFLTMIGAPSPTLLALIAFIGFAIPMVGTIASAIIITLVCLTASPEPAVAAGIYYLDLHADRGLRLHPADHGHHGKNFRLARRRRSNRWGGAGRHHWGPSSGAYGSVINDHHPSVSFPDKTSVDVTSRKAKDNTAKPFLVTNHSPITI